MPYSESYKKAVLAKVFGPPVRSAASVAKEEGIANSTVSKWIKELKRVKEMKRKEASRPTEWTAAEKLEVLIHTATLCEAELGVYLRQKGLYEATLKRWREEALTGLSGKQAVLSPKKTVPQKERQQLKALEHALHEKEKALAEMAVLLALKKKVQDIWGAEENGTAKTSGKSFYPF